MLSNSQSIDEILAENGSKSPMRAVIREEECIGCLKCVKACPVDSIIGTTKLMHTVMQDECIGCELCVAPCPMDCIDMRIIPARTYVEDKIRERFDARNDRLAKIQNEKAKKHQRAKTANPNVKATANTTAARKAFIADAVARTKAKRHHDDKAAK